MFVYRVVEGLSDFDLFSIFFGGTVSIGTITMVSLLVIINLNVSIYRAVCEEKRSRKINKKYEEEE